MHPGVSFEADPTLKRIRDRIEQGRNPVDVAGRESTRKDCLAPGHIALEVRAGGSIRLVEAAEWPEDRGRDIVRTCLESFRCKQRAGNGKVDLLVASEMENERRPILVMEPKADNVAGEDRLSRMSAGPEQMPGLVFFLGDSAMRDDGVLEKRGIFGRITVFDILDAWRELGLPKSGKDWPKRIRPGRKRLKFAFELDQGKRENTGNTDTETQSIFLRFCIRSGTYQRRKLGSLEPYPSQHRSEFKERRQILLVADHGKPPNITGNSSTADRSWI